jgi:RNA 2',3'-cyclic 3'-phosphodiesterase
MRLFFAVELSEAIKVEAGKVAARLAEGFGPSARRAVTWVAPAAMHLTVRFIGESDECVAAELGRRVAKPFATPAFSLAVGGAGVFPPSGPPRVIWLGLLEGARELAAVHAELEARLEGLGLMREDRPFRAHLTLGRVKAPLGPSARHTVASVPAASPGSCLVDHVTLFESHLSPAGARYTALARGALGARPVV